MENALKMRFYEHAEINTGSVLALGGMGYPGVLDGRITHPMLLATVS